MLTLTDSAGLGRWAGALLFALKQSLGSWGSPRQSGTGPVSTVLLLETVATMIAQGTTAASSEEKGN